MTVCKTVKSLSNPFWTIDYNWVVQVVKLLLEDLSNSDLYDKQLEPIYISKYINI